MKVGLLVPCYIDTFFPACSAMGPPANRRRALGLETREHVPDSDFDVPYIGPYDVTPVDSHARTDISTQPPDQILPTLKFHHHATFPASLEINMPYRLKDSPPALPPEGIDLRGHSEKGDIFSRRITPH